MGLRDDQLGVCQRYGAIFEVTDNDTMVGLSRNVRPGVFPLHGLRHFPAGRTCGWYIWAEDYSDADDFFEPVHVAHLTELCPHVLPYLGLAPGWRFLLAPDYADVWYDVALLNS